MAKKYTVKATDDLLKLSERFKSTPSSILRSNGLQTLTPGQTIVIPQRPAAYGGSYNPTIQPPTNVSNPFTSSFLSDTYVKPYKQTGFQTPTTNGFLAQPPKTASVVNPFSSSFLSNTYVRPYQQNSFQTPTTNGFLAPVQTGGNLSPDANGGGLRPAYTGFQTPTTNGFMSPGSQPVGGNFVGDQMGGQVPGTAVTPPPPTQPAVSRAEGKAQFLSGNGLNPQSGYIPTRSDVWNMKANSRRKAMAQSDNDENANDYVGGLDAPVELAPVVIPTLENQGNNSNAISWRVG